ncbi:MAG TPA: DbpA RNA binding domain-containing protein, partial [Polyangia bacterium]|nr:DbpA RNA binding domain-containing protein [Polyangia bacterium]
FWEVWSEEKAAQAASPSPPEDAVQEVANGQAPAPREIDRSAGFGPEAAPAPEGDVARLYLNLGRKDGAAENEIQDLLATHAGVSSVLGMDVMNTHTYINVPTADADRICAALTGKELGARELVCERAKPRRR